MRDNKHKMKKKKKKETFMLDIRTIFVPMRMVRHWSRLPSEVGPSPFWKHFKSPAGYSPKQPGGGWARDTLRSVPA